MCGGGGSPMAFGSLRARRCNVSSRDVEGKGEDTVLRLPRRTLRPMSTHVYLCQSRFTTRLFWKRYWTWRIVAVSRVTRRECYGRQRPLRVFCASVANSLATLILFFKRSVRAYSKFVRRMHEWGSSITACSVTVCMSSSFFLFIRRVARSG